MVDLNGAPLDVGDRVVFIGEFNYEPLLMLGTVTKVGDGFVYHQADDLTGTWSTFRSEQVYRLHGAVRESDHGSA